MFIYYATLALVELGLSIIGYKAKRKIVLAVPTVFLTIAVDLVTDLMLHHYGAQQTILQQFALWGIVVLPWLLSVGWLTYGSIREIKRAVALIVLANAAAIFCATVFAWTMIH